MTFQSTITHHSVLAKGVVFLIRRLSVLERAKRDASIFEQQLKVEELAAEYDALDRDEEKLPLDKAKARALDAQISQIMNLHVKPLVLKQGLIEIQGIEFEGSPITVEQFLETGDDQLIEEAYQMCEAASRLTQEQLKNLPSPGTSREQAAGVIPITSAGDASATPTTVGGTVINISPTT